MSQFQILGYLDIWLQRMIPKKLIGEYKGKFKELLCRMIDDDKICLWDVKWCKPSIQNIIQDTSIINREQYNKLVGTEISEEEAGCLRWDY